MAFDPSLPREDRPCDAPEMRGQLNALKALIDATPAGPQGPPGRDGVDGQPGRDGVDGAPGTGIAEIRDNGDGRSVIVLTDGTVIPPATLASGPAGRDGVDGVSLVMSGDWNSGAGYASGSVVAYNGQLYAAMEYAMGTPPDMDGRWRLLTITGPQGSSGGPGAQGSPGEKGDRGDVGPTGPPGEVTAQQLNDAVNGALATAAANSSANTNAVQLLDPDADLPAVVAKINEIILAQRR